MKTMFSVVAIGLMVFGGAFAQESGGPSNDWQAIRCKGVGIGLSEQQIDHTLKACRQAGLSVDGTDGLLAAVYAAHQEGLPVEVICVKIEEGLAKRIPVARIIEAANVRLECLREAAKLVASMHGKRGGMGGSWGGRMGRSGQGGDGPPHLIANIGMALESGVPVEVFQTVFEHAGTGRKGRIMPLVDAAEILHLAGLEPEQTQRMLNDILERNLNRCEVERVVEVVVQGLADGKDFELLHADLWVEKSR